MDDDVFSTAVLEKLPLADAVWRLLHFTLDDPWLEDLWTRHRGRCYEQDLKFSTLAHLIADALLEHGGSGNQAFERAQEREILPVSITSAYEKLGNLPLPVSEALLEEGTRRMNAVLPEVPAVDPLPDCWADHELFGADGKAIKHVKRLLKPLRGLGAGIPGARASVGLNLRTGLWRWPWPAISTAKPVKGPSPKTWCRSWPRRPARGGRGWWCWTDSTAT